MRCGGGCRLLILIAAAAVSSHSAPAGDASFRLEAFSPKPYTAAYLGNGAIGLETTPLATTPGHSLLAGVYDDSPGDVPRIASAPAWNEVDIYHSGVWLNAAPPSESLTSYHQVLDMYDGVLRTSYTWTRQGKQLEIKVEQFVSRDRAGVAATSVVMEPRFAGRIKVRLPLRNWPPPHRYQLAKLQKLDAAAAKDQWLIWYPGYLEVSHVEAERGQSMGLLSLLAHAPGTNLDEGEAVALEWPAEVRDAVVHKEADGAWVELDFDTVPGKALRFIKFLALSRNGQKAAVALVKQIQALGWQALLTESITAWNKLWESDILVEGDPSLQRVIHSMLFYLMGSTREDASMSTPPMGLSSAGYYGHIFWDADTFMFPALVLLHPSLARPMVAFRSRTREAALKNAVANGYHGAMYPWEAGPDGGETTPLFAGQNGKYENHVNGDVALAAWQYWLATEDRGWLEHDCWPILRDTANFWVSRVSLNAAKKRYEIGNVVAVNESLIGFDNDPWTNAVAQRNLQLAIETAHLVGQQPDAKWQKVADAMYLPDSDSALLWFPLDRQLSLSPSNQSLEKALTWIRSGRGGAMMGNEFYPIMAAESGNRKLIGQMIGPLSTPYLRPPFQVIAETPHNRNVNFITGAGAFLQQFVFGYSGLRLTERGLEQKYPAVLPPSVSKVTLKNISVRGKRQTLTFSATAAVPNRP